MLERWREPRDTLRARAWVRARELRPDAALRSRWRCARARPLTRVFEHAPPHAGRGPGSRASRRRCSPRARTSRRARRRPTIASARTAGAIRHAFAELRWSDAKPSAGRSRYAPTRRRCWLRRPRRIPPDAGFIQRDYALAARDAAATSARSPTPPARARARARLELAFP
jgi:hypothetical protein